LEDVLKFIKLSMCIRYLSPEMNYMVLIHVRDCTGDVVNVVEKLLVLPWHCRDSILVKKSTTRPIFMFKKGETEERKSVMRKNVIDMGVN